MMIIAYIAAAFIALVMLTLYACMVMAGRQDEADRRYAESWKEQGK